MVESMVYHQSPPSTVISKQEAKLEPSIQKGITSIEPSDFNCEYLIDVSSENFKPVPKVQSSVIKLTRNNTLELGCTYSDFLQVVKACFSQRRKKISSRSYNDATACRREI